MSSKQCGKCGEQVDEAKAFCPGCGNAFVEEEERKTQTGFDMSNDTIKLGDTLYNQLLSDMGLSISKSPNKGDTPVKPNQPEVTILPAVKPVNKKPASWMWLIFGAVAVIVLLFLLILALGIVIWLRPDRFAF